MDIWINLAYWEACWFCGPPIWFVQEKEEEEKDRPEKSDGAQSALT